MKRIIRFDLREYSTGKYRVETMDARPVKIITLDSGIPDYPILGVVDRAYSVIYSKEGRALSESIKSTNDLFLIYEEPEFYINVYEADWSESGFISGNIQVSLEETKKCIHNGGNSIFYGTYKLVKVDE